MTLLGVGVDIVSVDRFERSLEQPGFLDRIMGLRERSDLPPAGPRRSSNAAVKFAVKEAVLKALGTGAWVDGIDFPQVIVMGAPPQVTLVGVAGDRWPDVVFAVATSKVGDRILASAWAHGPA